MCFELLLNKTFKLFFSKNDLEICKFLYYVCIVLQQKFKNEFSFVSFEQNMRKKMHFKSLIYKTISQR